MRISWLLALPAVLSPVSALAIEKRDADFLSVRTKMHKDMSGKGGDPKDKYFHESIFHPHYDGRFADHQLPYLERKKALSNLIQTYLATFADIGVETWLMHGTLLGWWWNRKILPWDSDSDVQVSESSMHYLASYYNMTVFHYKTPRIPDGRDYMLEINPHYTNRSQSDTLNVIDARWVDTTSGLFIDITTARYNWTHPAGEGMLSCKDGHEYRDSYIFPLRDTFFEGVPAKIPFAYKEVLEAEYHKKALSLTIFEGHQFDEEKLEWVPIMNDIKPPASPWKAPAKQETPPPVAKQPTQQDSVLPNPTQQNAGQQNTAPQNPTQQKSSTPMSDTSSSLTPTTQKANQTKDNVPIDKKPPMEAVLKSEEKKRIAEEEKKKKWEETRRTKEAQKEAQEDKRNQRTRSG